MWERSNKRTEIYPSSNVSEEENDSSGVLSGSRSSERKSKRNLFGFWLLGLCNYFGFVVMLIAAHDILHQEKTSNRGNQTYMPNASSIWHVTESLQSADGLECSPFSTGTVLLADILPSFVISITAPFFMQRTRYSVRMAICVLFAFASFSIVAFSRVLWITLLGVAFASLSSGLGEATLLSYSAHFDRDVVSTWSSGTGGSSAFGALSYAGLISSGITPRNTVLIMNVIPFLMGICYWFILEHPEGITEREPLLGKARTEGADKLPVVPLTFGKKLTITKSLMKFILPIFFIYFAEYFINQGLHELIYWNRIWLSPSDQYRWYQVSFRVGTFISRSSVNIFPIKKTWLLAVLQNVNLVILLCEAYFPFLPSVWIMFLISLYVGLLGGSCYVNTFYRISQEVPPEHREFSMGVTSVPINGGIALAGVAVLPAHRAFCTYWRNKMRS
nr:battenin-like [Pocillopora verrucosa]